jgi:membrane associated rhomboid family serine protease
MFLHDPNGFSHILFNMLMLWMFGKDIETVWGTRRFLQYYLICGIGAGICVVVLNTLFGSTESRTIGASGAIYGLLLAYGMLFPEQTVMFSLLFPVKAKYFVIIMGGIAFLATFRSTGDGVSHVAHLGGMIWGYLFLRSKMIKIRAAPSKDWYGSLRARYNHWRLDRAKRKFQVYMRKHNKSRGGSGGFMH